MKHPFFSIVAMTVPERGVLARDELEFAGIPLSRDRWSSEHGLCTFSGKLHRWTFRHGADYWQARASRKVKGIKCQKEWAGHVAPSPNARQRRDGFRSFRILSLEGLKMFAIFLNERHGQEILAAQRRSLRRASKIRVDD